MKRSLIAFQALLASSAVLCQTAEASSTYSAPEHLNDAAKANSIEARIEAVRNTDWGSLLKDPEIEDELVAKSKWKNGKGKKFGNSYGKGKWGNGSNKFWEHGTLASSETRMPLPLRHPDPHASAVGAVRRRPSPDATHTQSIGVLMRSIAVLPLPANGRVLMATDRTAALASTA